MRSLVLALSCLAACSTQYRDFDASTVHDAGVPDEGMIGEGGVPASALFTITGCDKLAFDNMGDPTCTVGPHRSLTFVPVGAGVDALVWTFPSGNPSTSMAISPVVSWSAYGTYTVMLAAAANGGSAVSSGTVSIVAQAAGAACQTDSDCDATMDLTCLCGEGQGCPAGLDAGICVHRCETSACAAGDACIDLTRGVPTSDASTPDAGVDGGTGTDYRVRACLPICSDSTTCSTGFSCRAMPEVAVGAAQDASYTWTQVCFATGVLGDVGASCDDADGTPDGTRCTTGVCEKLGARGVCTDDCSGSIACPQSAACATMPSVGSRCLATCTSDTDCNDPWLACEGAGMGGLGFTLAQGESASTMLCAEKRCTKDSDCGPSGSCSTVGGALFCGP